MAIGIIPPFYYLYAMNTKIALVTGATSGIGWETAKILSENGYKIIACGRRKERLDTLSSELKTEMLPLLFDVANKNEVKNAIDSIPLEWKNITLLVNNAGNAHGLNPFDEANLDDWEKMMDINVKGLLYVSHFVLPFMPKNSDSHIVNIGSIAGKEVYPNGSVYCASKHAVDAISKAMKMDLNKFGIRVSEINPGLVETEFSLVRFKGDSDRAKTVYQGYQPLLPKDIADIIWFVVNRPKHVNISDIVVMPTAQASATQVKKDV
jgi:3-hydroxy acid dehydrogenase / malonic semialdehyde reductase